MIYKIIGLLIFAMLVSASTSTGTDTVTRTLPASASPGDTIIVSLAVDFSNPASTTQLAITETVPSGWTVVSASAGGNIVSQPGKISWVKANALGNMPADGTTFTYTVTVPGSAVGTATFSGLYGTNIAGTNLPILGSAFVTVTNPTPTPLY